MAYGFGVLTTILFFSVLIFGTHFVRTWAFNRHEAITFESSAVSAFVFLLFIWQYGASLGIVVRFILLLLMFATNAFIQWYFYMELQRKIAGKFEKRRQYIKERMKDTSLNDALLIMASVAIMPSFSRFIEESKSFNNPGNLIGLIKSIMKRQRFQKKKYLMRECLAENVNLIGPCVPEINNVGKEKMGRIPGAVHADDFALDKKQEITGLLSFDILGFGAFGIAFGFIIYHLNHPLTYGLQIDSSEGKIVLMLLSALAYTFFSHILRHIGFARYESICYELSFTALMIVSFRLFSLSVEGSTGSAVPYIVVGVYYLVFLFLSYTNKHLDKELHDKINNAYTEVIDTIRPEKETERVKRRFLSNLCIINEWASVPFPGRKKHFLFQKKINWFQMFSEFEEINRKKQDMAALNSQMLNKVVPKHSRFDEDFKLDEGKLKKFRIMNDTISIVSFVTVFVLVYLRII